MATIEEIKRKVGTLIAEKGLSLNSLSLSLGKNSSYLQKFVKQKSPRRLDEQVRKNLAQILNVPEQELTDIVLSTSYPCNIQPSLDEQKFKDVVSTAYKVFAEYPFKEKTIEILANKFADICYDAAQINTNDRYAQIKTLVHSWYNNDNKIAG